MSVPYTPQGRLPLYAHVDGKMVEGNWANDIGLDFGIDRIADESITKSACGGTQFYPSCANAWSNFILIRDI